MAKKASDAAVAVETQTADPKPVLPQATHYTKEKLRENALALFNVGAHVIDGALYNKPEPLTLDEARKAIDDWQGQKVTGPSKPVRRKGGR